MKKQYWLRCQTEKGMFPDEMSVVSHTSDGTAFSLFADLHYIKEKHHYGENLLSVQLCESNGTTFLVKLPADPFETRKFVSVEKDQVIEYA